jgi:broad specificity phosphatase PhoE
VTPSVWLLRHGDTEWTESERHTGRRDIPLSERGRRQATAAGRRLTGRRFTQVFVSPQARARETAERAGVAAGARVHDDLVEWDYGEYEGLTDAETHERAPGWDLFREGCPGGESPQDVTARVSRVLRDVDSVAGDCLLVAHGKLLRALTGAWLGVGIELGAALALEPAAISVLGRTGEVAQLRLWNLAPDGSLGD